MTFIWKNFVSMLVKFKTASLLNILGLSVALAVFIVVAIQVKYDLTYDHSYENADRIFVLEALNMDGEKFIYSDLAFAERVGDEIPGMEAIAITDPSSLAGIPVEKAFEVKIGGSSEIRRIDYTAARGDFMKVFSPEIIAGDAAGVFHEPDKLMISRRTAEAVFGDTDPVGQILFYHGESTPLTIAAVYEDFPENSTVKNGIYGYLEDRTMGRSYIAYYLTDPKNAPKAGEVINSVEFLGQDQINFYEAEPSERETFELNPLKSFYLNRENEGGSKPLDTTLSLLVIGILVLVIAYINFINLAMAMAPSRVKSINIHRILGIGKENLRIALAFEGVLLTVVALGLALVYVRAFGSTPMVSLFSSSMSLDTNISLLVGVSLCAMVAAFLIGTYAARYSTSFDVAIALKSSFALSGKAGKLRNALIVVQFTAAMALTAIASMVAIQHEYMRSYSTGLDKENVVILSGANLGQQNWETFGDALKNNTNITDWTVSGFTPGYVLSEFGANFEGKNISYNGWPVYPNFLRFFGVDVVAGEDFPGETGEQGYIMFNREFLKQHEFDESIIGKELYPFGGTAQIRGIAEDINFASLHEPIAPLGFIVTNVQAYWDMIKAYDLVKYYVKIAGNDIPATMDYIEGEWEKFTNVDFDYRFLDDEMDALYRRESNMAKLIGLFGLITVIIAMMGVYGLIFFNARYRTREIAIRRVNGAEIREIVTLLNREMGWQLIVAFVLATAIAVFVIGRWMDGFAFRADVPLWLYPAAGAAVALVSLATVSWQSLVAATTNPVKALKSE